MIVTTTDVVDGHRVAAYLGIVTGEAVSGANIVRDVMATVTDYVGGRSGTYEEVLAAARQNALDEMTDRARLLHADAVVGVSLDYETVGSRGAMLLVTATGTAVQFGATAG